MNKTTRFLLMAFMVFSMTACTPGELLRYILGLKVQFAEPSPATPTPTPKPVLSTARFEDTIEGDYIYPFSGLESKDLKSCGNAEDYWGFIRYSFSDNKNLIIRPQSLDQIIVEFAEGGENMLTTFTRQFGYGLVIHTILDNGNAGPTITIINCRTQPTKSGSTGLIISVEN